MEICNF